MPVFDQTNGVTYNTLSQAISGSASADTLLVPAGSYVENFPDITHDLTIIATGGLASLTNPQPAPPNGRAIVTVPANAGVNLTISGLEISGAARPGANPNGAGILFESGNGNLTVSNSWVHDNQDGILTGGPTAFSPIGGMNVTISHAEVSNNGAPIGSAYAAAGQDHNIYAGSLTSLTVSNSYIHSVFSQGSEIKSRALTTVITGNRIDDLPNLTPGALGASYVVDIPNGGSAIVSGNVLEKGPNAVNRYIVHFGGEGTYPGGHLTLSNNLIISDRTAGATVLFNQTADPAIAGSNVNMPADILGNTLFGIDPGLLFQDQYGPPFDNVGANLFPAGAAPALDTSPGFAISVMEPTGVAMLIMAIIVLGLTRHARILSPIWRHARVLTRDPINP